MSIVLPDHSFARLAVAAETARDILTGPLADTVNARINGVPLADHLTEIIDWLQQMAPVEPAARRALAGLKVPS